MKITKKDRERFDCNGNMTYCSEEQYKKMRISESLDMIKKSQNIIDECVKDLIELTTYSTEQTK